MQYWLAKTEPTTYSWNDLLSDEITVWDGVRNYQARNNLKNMRPGDLCLIYHSGKEKSVVGVAEVTKKAFRDPTTKDTQWVCVELMARKTLEEPVALKDIKKNRKLRHMTLIRQSRLSVMQLSSTEFRTIVAVGKTKL